MSDFFEATKIADNEDNYRNNLIDALERARNAGPVSRRWQRSINRNRAESSSAAHPASRLDWASALSDAIEDQFCTEGLHHRPDVFFVTLIDRDWVTPVNAPVDLAGMKRKIRTIASGRSCFFVIEPGYYANIQDSLFRDRACISWHIHGLMWGNDASNMRELVNSVNCSAKYRTLIPTGKPAHFVVVKQGHLPRFVGYMAKPPANAYRVLCHRKQQRDRERALRIEVPAIYVQRKQSLRPGERVLLFHALKDIDPLDLLIGCGEGRQLTRQIRLRLS